MKNPIFRRTAVAAVLTAAPVIIALGTAAISEAATGPATSGADDVAVTAPRHVSPPSSFAPRPMVPGNLWYHHRHHHHNW